MCGIFAVINDAQLSAAKTSLLALKTLEYRGYDSWGIAVVTATGLQFEKHVGKIGSASTSLNKSPIAIGHTRWATHGGVTTQNAHPHIDSSNRFALVHNGIVENYTKLKKTLQNSGVSFQSQTDSEVIVELIASEYLKQNNILHAVASAFKQLEGANGIVVLDAKSQSVLACRNGSPILLGICDETKEIFLSSDATALISKADRYTVLEEDQVALLSRKGVQSFSLNDFQEQSFSWQPLNMSAASIQKGKYKHFLIKEIHEQPEIIKQFTNRIDEFVPLAKLLQKADRVFITGCGSAYHAALFGWYFFAESGMMTQVIFAHEISQFEKIINDESIVIAVSQSGETADTLLAVRTAQLKGAKVLSVINARGSSLERISDQIIPVGAGPEISVVSSKAFIAQITALYILSVLCKSVKSNPTNSILTLSFALNSLLSKNSVQKIKSVATSLSRCEHLYLIGKGTEYITALECSLKLKETAYLHAEAFASSELKHGVLSLIQNDSICLVFCANTPQFNQVISSASEISARGGKIIGISAHSSEIFDIWIQTPQLPPHLPSELSAIVHVVIGQLFAYYLGLERGADPDKPRNLAKSVTVR